MVDRVSGRKIRGVMASVLMVLAGWSASPVEAQTPHPRPSSFFGTVTLDGEPIASSVPVAAWIGGVSYAATMTANLDGGAQYSLDVPGDLVGTSEVEGGVASDEVRFRVGDSEIATTATWISGEHVELNLEANIGPDLSLEIDDGGDSIVPSAVATYVLTVAHIAGDGAPNTSLRFSLPPDTTLVSASDGAIDEGGTILWSPFDVGEGGSVTRSVTLRVNAAVPFGAEVLQAIGRVSLDPLLGLDPNPDDNVAMDENDLIATPDLAVVIDDGTFEAVPGQRLRYRLEISNHGDQGASGVVATALVPGGTLPLAASHSGAIAGRSRDLAGFRVGRW